MITIAPWTSAVDATTGVNVVSHAQRNEAIRGWVAGWYVRSGFVFFALRVFVFLWLFYFYLMSIYVDNTVHLVHTASSTA